MREMTFDELRGQIDEFIGIQSTVEEDQWGQRDLLYHSPTGIVLLTIRTYEPKDGMPGTWIAGGYGQPVPEIGGALQRINGF